MKAKIDDRTGMNRQFITADLLHWLENTELRFGLLKGKAKKLCLILIAMLTVNGIIAQEKNALISFEKKKHDFGEINFNQDSVVQATFTFMNKGSSPLVIHKVTASCGCTTPEWTTSPVKQGDKGFIKVTFNSKGYTGKFSKSIFVSSNATKDVEILRIEGEVVTDKQKSFFDRLEVFNMRLIIITGIILLCVFLYLALIIDIMKSKMHISLLWLLAICFLPILGPVLYLSFRNSIKY
ncbi:MAG: DUF1573 domain-containing protein [Prevotellaceae bacterium]|nr:DUF1573 domain-containing protein [Prevotellaceae bacterium]